MLRSMTAFGRAERSTPEGRLSVEIQTLNRKHLEIFLNLPREYSSVESEMRKAIEQKMHRGKISVRVEAVYEKESPISVAPNLSLVRQAKEAWEKIAEEVGATVSPEEILQILSQNNHVLQYEEKELGSFKETLFQVLHQAIDEACKMKEVEGSAIESDFRQRIVALRKMLAEIEKEAPQATLAYREKLKQRLAEIQEGVLDLVDREVAVYAEKIDITEEIVRFYSHLDQFESYLDKSQNTVGKTLEFLLQELSRETHTIGAKSSDTNVSRIVVEMKTELERLREQVQNIE